MSWEDSLLSIWSGAKTPTPTVAPVALPSSPDDLDDDAAVLAETATKLTEPAEGEELHPYQDPGGVWTIGTGSTFDLDGNPVTANTPPITPAQDLILLERELKSALQTVKNDTSAPLSLKEKAALTDLVFNIGSGNYHASSVRQCLLAGDYDGACQHIADWDQQHGEVLAGLVKRRCAEQAEFKQGETS